MAGPDRVTFTINTETGGGQQFSIGGLALLAPLDANATVSANDVDEYPIAQLVADDHGDGSALHDGAQAALSQVDSILAVGVDDFTDDGGTTSPFTESLGDSSSGTLGDTDSDGSSERAPLTDVSSFKTDGSAIAGDILYTTDDPTTLTEGTDYTADDVIINPISGDYQIGTNEQPASGGTSEATYTVHDWTAAFNALNENPYEIAVPAGFDYKAANAGVYDEFLTNAQNHDKTLITAAASGAAAETGDATDLKTTVNAQSDRAFQVHAHKTSAGDAQSAFAALVANTPVAGTLVGADAPRGLTFDTVQYNSQEIGDPDSPATDTFFDIGVVPTYRRGLNGPVKISGDLSTVAGTEFFRNISTWRALRFVNLEVEQSLQALRDQSRTSVPFNGIGRRNIHARIKEALDRLVNHPEQGNVIEPVDMNEITVPAPDTLSDTDITKRIWRNIEYPVPLVGQAEVFTVVANARLA